MNLLTKTQFDRLIKNGRRQKPVRGTPQEIDFKPVVKLFNPFVELFNPSGKGIWLLTEIDPETPDRAFGLCCIETPELRYVSLLELKGIPLPFGMRIERKLHWKADKTLDGYYREALRTGRIVA